MESVKTQVGGAHYTMMTIQPLDFAIKNKLNFFQLNIIKYITRLKGDREKKLEDLYKAQHYINTYIDAIESGEWQWNR